MDVRIPVETGRSPEFMFWTAEMSSAAAAIEASTCVVCLMKDLGEDDHLSGILAALGLDPLIGILAGLGLMTDFMLSELMFDDAAHKKRVTPPVRPPERPVRPKMVAPQRPPVAARKPQMAASRVSAPVRPVMAAKPKPPVDDPYGTGMLDELTGEDAPVGVMPGFSGTKVSQNDILTFIGSAIAEVAERRGFTATDTLRVAVAKTWNAAIDAAERGEQRLAAEEASKDRHTSTQDA